MILYFPSLHLLRLAITTTVIPESVSAAGAKVGFDERGGVWVQPAAVVSEETLAALKRHGVLTAPAPAVALDEDVCCWLQVLPLERVAEVVPGGSAPVLFDVPGDQLFDLVGEMLRLGNDRQSFRWLSSTPEDSTAERALLRVIGPPYYSL